MVNASKQPVLGENKATNDFFVDEKWRTLYIGFAPSKNVWYYLYRCFVATFFIYMISMSVTAAVLKPEKSIIIFALQSILSNVFATSSLLSRLLNHRSIKEVCSILKCGVYSYEYEDDNVRKLRASIPVEIHSKGNHLLALCTFIVLGNGILFPVTQILMLEDAVDDVVNPYFPALFYQPYDTSSGIGFYSCFLLGMVFHLLLFGVVVALNWIIMSFAVNVKTHFKVLSYSLNTIEHRALIRYNQEFGKPWVTSLNTLLPTPEFQRCLYDCLRSNIQHHQILLRILKLLKPFYGLYVLNLFTTAPTVYGVFLYLMNQNPPVNVMILLLATFVRAQYPVIDMCIIGQQILDESEKVFLSLYSIDWFMYNKRFNLTLCNMMSNTLRPSGLRALLARIFACNEVYGDLTTAMYKLYNLVRQSDDI